MALLLLLLIPAGLATGFTLVGYCFSTLGRAGIRRTGRGVWFRCVAALLGAVAAAAYTWGLLIVGLTVLEAEDGGTDSSPLRPCRIAGQPMRALDVVGYSVSYVPLGFVCETDDDKDYTAPSVPGYVNPAAFGFALAALVCTAAAALESGRGVRKGLAA